MTAKRRLIPPAQIREALDVLAEYGIDVAACTIDIRADGITVSPGPKAPRDEYEEWQAKERARDRLGSR
jgi:anthranilate/para-aminobenzoate synthase component II